MEWSFRVAVLMLIVAATPAVVKAQTASEHFPNDDGSANVQVPGPMNLTLKVEGLGRPVMAGVTLAAGETGQQVAVDSARQLCLAALAAPNLMTCDDPTCAFPIGSTKSITCTKGATGFGLTRINTQTSFTVSPIGDRRIQSLHCRTASGNTHGPDLLARVLVRVEPNGVNGNTVFRVNHFQGGQNPRNFTVNTTGLSDQALHEAIRNGYNAMGLGLAAAIPQAGCFLSFDPAQYTGRVVEVNYSPSTLFALQNFEVDGRRTGATLGQIITMETAGCAPPLPPAAECPIDTLLFQSNKTTLIWGAPPAGCSLPMSFDVLRAPLGCRCNTCVTTIECNDSTNMTASDTTIPPGPGQGFWYLARVRGGTWNSTSTNQCGTHDTSPALGCP